MSLNIDCELVILLIRENGVVASHLNNAPLQIHLEQCVVGSIPHCGPIELLFELVLNNWCHKSHSMLFCLWDGVYKRSLAANHKEKSEWPYTICQHNITIKKMC